MTSRESQTGCICIVQFFCLIVKLELTKLVIFFNLSQIFFHGSKMKDSLHKHLAPSHLPKDYDGDLPKIDYTGADWYPVITELHDHIQKWNSFGLKKKN